MYREFCLLVCIVHDDTLQMGKSCNFLFILGISKGKKLPTVYLCNFRLEVKTPIHIADLQLVKLSTWFVDCIIISIRRRSLR